MTAALALEPGELFAERYKVERLLGRGGMGVVYAARHPVLDQTVAIKVLASDVADDDELKRRFVNEARASALIENEHVVRVFDVVTDAGSGAPFMVMEHLEGSDLGRVLANEGKLPYAVAVDYVRQALSAVAAAHKAGVVHRDLKPSNLFRVDRRDGTKMIKVLDFGISKVPRNDGSETTTDALLGSPAYMAPEQARSTKRVTTSADLWSLGVVLYELISAKRPFVGANVGQVIVSVLEEEPPALDPSLAPEGLRALIMKCLSKEPASRPASAEELSKALEPFANPATPQVPTSQKRVVWPFAVAGVAVLGTVVVLARPSSPPAATIAPLPPIPVTIASTPLPPVSSEPPPPPAVSSTPIPAPAPLPPPKTKPAPSRDPAITRQRTD